MSADTESKKRRVLLVDDDPFIIAVYTAKLKRAGLEVDPVSDGAEALRHLETVRPDLVILDLNMPKLNGIEVLKFIRNAPPLESLPVLVLTNVCSDSVVRETWQARPTRYLIKRETPPNVVVEEVTQLLSSAPHPETPAPVEAAPPVAAAAPAEAGRVDDRAAEYLNEFRAAKSPETVRESLVKLRQSLSPQLQACRQQPPGSFPSIFDEALGALFEDVYAHAEAVNASLVRAMEMGVERLRKMFSEQSAMRGVAAEVAVLMVASEDDYLRQSLGRMLRRPHLRPICVGDIGTALHLLRENVFQTIVLDAYPEEEYLARIHAVPGAEHCPVIAVTPLQHYRPAQRPGCERVAKPVNATDIALKALLLSQPALSA